MTATTFIVDPALSEIKPVEIRLMNKAKFTIISIFAKVRKDLKQYLDWFSNSKFTS